MKSKTYLDYLGDQLSGRERISILSIQQKRFQEDSLTLVATVLHSPSKHGMSIYHETWLPYSLAI